MLLLMFDQFFERALSIKLIYTCLLGCFLFFVAFVFFADFPEESIAQKTDMQENQQTLRNHPQLPYRKAPAAHPFVAAISFKQTDLQE